MKLLKIKLEDFKGFTGKMSGKEICFEGRNLIEGQNGAGKSTLMDAHFWLFADKDSHLKSNPDIRPDDGHECTPRVEEEWEIDGISITVAKMQKKTVGKPDARGISKITLANKYEINGVPKTERDFKKDLTARGFDFDNFLPLSHIDAFTGGKPDDMRKVLFGMTTFKTDKEVAESLNECEAVALLLQTHRADEIEAMNKASKKKAEEQIQAIPNQIIGMEKSKVNIDTSVLELQRDTIKQQITEIENQISDSMAYIRISETITDKIRALKKKNEEIEIEANRENDTRRRDLDFEIKELNHKKRLLSDDLKTAEMDLRQAKMKIQRCTSGLEQARTEYIKYSQQEFDESELREIEAEQFNENELICPTCGQDFPESRQHKIREQFLKNKEMRIRRQEAARKAFNESIELRLETITESGNKAKQDLKEAEKFKNDAEGKIEQCKKDISGVEEKLVKLTADLGQIPQSVDLSDNPEYQDILREISNKESDLENIGNSSEYRTKKENELKLKHKELSAIEAEIAKAENDVRIDEEILELQKKQREYGQKKADADNILYQLSLVSKAKNTLLESKINSWFNGVRFKLFDYLKNGEYKEVCVPEILNDNGEWKSIGSTANTALEMKGKLAIVEGLQKFYGVNYPVFVDGAERLDDKTMAQIQADFQIIFLKVSEGELKVGEIV